LAYAPAKINCYDFGTMLQISEQDAIQFPAGLAVMFAGGEAEFGLSGVEHGGNLLP
jgi:hypothetical protein